jgi:hypothetical protein
LFLAGDVGPWTPLTPCDTSVTFVRDSSHNYLLEPSLPEPSLLEPSFSEVAGMRKKPLRAVSVAFVFVGLMIVAAGGLVLAQGRPFATNLTGAAEVPTPGDPDGSGVADLTLNHGQAEVCFTLNVSGITLPATAAHIHQAPAGVPGPVVVPLVPPDATGVSTGCVSPVDGDLIKAIIQHPEEYYVNVHNADFPAGALRGQLSK